MDSWDWLRVPLHSCVSWAQIVTLSLILSFLLIILYVLRTPYNITHHNLPRLTAVADLAQLSKGQSSTLSPIGAMDPGKSDTLEAVKSANFPLERDPLYRLHGY